MSVQRLFPSVNRVSIVKFYAFKQRVQQLKAGYKGLGDALRECAIQLGSPGPKQPSECDTRQSDMHVKERPQESLRDSDQKDDVVNSKRHREQKVRFITPRFAINPKSAKGSPRKAWLG